MYELPRWLRPYACPLVLVLAVLAGALIFIGDMTGTRVVYDAGLVGICLAPVLLIAYRSQHIIEAIERARQDAYDEGYDDGRSVRPKVVPLRDVS